MVKQKDFKKRILKGAFSLAAKQLLVVFLSFVSVLVTARVLGPEEYGIATISLGLFYFLIGVLNLGISPYIVRQPEIDETEITQIQSFFTTIACVICLFLWLLAPAIGWWTKRPEVTIACRWLLPALWMSMVAITSTSMIERELRFVELGLVEGIGQAANYLLAIALALLGWGYMALVWGTVVRYAISAVLAYAYRPVSIAWKWDWKIVKPALDFGVKYSVSAWLLNLKNLRVSLIVSRFISAEAAGIVGISIRLVQQLSILKMVIQRMSISIMAKLKDPHKIRQAISKGMAYQALLNCSICAFFSVSSAWVIPIIFGEKWMESASLFPLIAAGILALTIFNLHSSTLYANGHIREVASFHFFYVGILWVLSLILTPTLGVWGYAISEIVALPAFYMLHRSVSKLYGSPNYWQVFWILLATLPSLYGGIFLSPAVGLALFIISFVLLLALRKNIRALLFELI